MESKLSTKLRFATPKGSREAHREGKMYGVLMESVRMCIMEDYGEDRWLEICRKAGVQASYIVHENYDDETILKLANGCSNVLNMTVDDVMFYYGLCFVKFCQTHGYYQILSVMGRHFHDFLHGIDDLHENMRYSYPSMSSPLFKVESEDKHGCVLRYESRRTGFTHYVMGQLTGIATNFYGIPKAKLKITVLKNEQEHGCGSRVHYRLDFKNTGFDNKKRAAEDADTLAKTFCGVHAEVFLKLFPFCIVFDENLQIRVVGESLQRMFSQAEMVGENLKDLFILRRPIVVFNWSNLKSLQKVVHELETSEELMKGCPSSRDFSNLLQSKIILRGQMKFVEDWGYIAFLCKPLAGNMTDMRGMGLFISDLCLYDRGREIAISEKPHSSHIEEMYMQQRKIADEIERIVAITQIECDKSDALLNAIMPPEFVKRLKAGEKSPSQKYESVTILFSYLVGFKEVCEQAPPDIIVKSLNRIFAHFDPIIEKHGLFKVETLGDAVYMVSGGVPDEMKDHAHRVAGLALELVQEAPSLHNPMNGEPHSVRIGMDSGSVVAGVVGMQTPQYCLFGDTVNTAARMQSYSESGRIHLSAPCRNCLRDSEYLIVFRGRLNIKGKGTMKTYWLAGRDGDEDALRMCRILRAERDLQKHLTPKSPETLSQFDLHSLHLASSTSTFASMDGRHSSEENEAEAGLIETDPQSPGQGTLSPEQVNGERSQPAQTHNASKAASKTSRTERTKSKQSKPWKAISCMSLE